MLGQSWAKVGFQRKTQTAQDSAGSLESMYRLGLSTGCFTSTLVIGLKLGVVAVVVVVVVMVDEGISGSLTS